jgi:hypothetical protein
MRGEGMQCCVSSQAVVCSVVVRWLVLDERKIQFFVIDASYQSSNVQCTRAIQLDTGQPLVPER